MLKIIITIIALSFSSLTLCNERDLAYQRKVSKRLLEYPNDLKTIIDAGSYFYKKNKYKKAIYYFSSPRLVNHQKYHTIKILQARAHYNLGEYKYAYDILTYLYTLNLSSNEKRKVKTFYRKVKQYYQPRKKDKTASYDSNKIYTILSLYYGQLSYAEEAKKESGKVMGAYLMLANKLSTFELSYEKLDLNFTEESEIDPYSQNDFVFSYGRFNRSYNHKGRFLYHTNSINSDYSYKSDSMSLNYDYYYSKGSSVGVDFALTDFTENAESDDFKSTQVTPKLTFNLFGKSLISAKYYYASNTYGGNDTLETTGDKNSSSLELLFATLFKTVNFNLSYSFGSEQFLLKNNGFLIQNSTDTTKSSLSSAISVKLSSKFTAKIKYTKNIYQEEGSNESFENNSILAFTSINF